MCNIAVTVLWATAITGLETSDRDRCNSAGFTARYRHGRRNEAGALMNKIDDQMYKNLNYTRCVIRTVFVTRPLNTYTGRGEERKREGDPPQVNDGGHAVTVHKIHSFMHLQTNE